jgi:hypothetical protein
MGDVPSPNLIIIPTILSHDLSLVRNVLDPMNKLRPATSHLALLGEWRQAGKDEDGDATAGGIVYSGSETLSADVDVYEDGLRLSGNEGHAVCGGEGDHLEEMLDAALDMAQR